MATIKGDRDSFINKGSLQDPLEMGTTKQEKALRTLANTLKPQGPPPKSLEFCKKQVIRDLRSSSSDIMGLCLVGARACNKILTCSNNGTASRSLYSSAFLAHIHERIGSIRAGAAKQKEAAPLLGAATETPPTVTAPSKSAKTKEGAKKKAKRKAKRGKRSPKSGKHYESSDNTRPPGGNPDPRRMQARMSDL